MANAVSLTRMVGSNGVSDTTRCQLTSSSLPKAEQTRLAIGPLGFSLIEAIPIEEVRNAGTIKLGSDSCQAGSIAIPQKIRVEQYTMKHPAIYLLLLSCCASQQTLSPILDDEFVSSAAPKGEAKPRQNEEFSTGRAFVREVPSFDGQSLTVEMSTWVRAAPFSDAAPLGMIEITTRVKPSSRVINTDCPVPWIELDPRGFVCAPTSASHRPPNVLPESKDVKHLPGAYAVATDSSIFYESVEDALYNMGGRGSAGDMVKHRATIPMGDGTQLWRTNRNEYVDRKTLRRTRGSSFLGVQLTEADSPQLPFAFAMQADNHRSPIAVYNAPLPTSRVVSRLKARTVLEVLGESSSGEYWEISGKRFVRKNDVRVVEKQPVPTEVDAGGKWLDVDLARQLVVAYVGTEPVFATLASTGKGGTSTPEGVYKITRKKAETTMRNDRSDEQSYSVAVPWAVYFQEGYAFHGAYWHNNFGTPRSHGCVNLSPGDAYEIYQFTEPHMPPGWSTVYGHETQPGTVVWVH